MINLACGSCLYPLLGFLRAFCAMGSGKSKLRRQKRKSIKRNAENSQQPQSGSAKLESATASASATVPATFSATVPAAARTRKHLTTAFESVAAIPALASKSKFEYPAAEVSETGTEQSMHQIILANSLRLP